MNQETTCPEMILASIAWYPDGLTPEEGGAVEAHAADCAACRSELAILRGEEEPAIELPDADRVYARVLERIEWSKKEAWASIDGRGFVATLRRLRRRAKGPVSVAAGLLVALVSGMLTVGVIWVTRVTPTYTSAANRTEISVPSGPTLQIVFRADATAGEIHAGLRAAGASVESGPSDLGVYRARLAPGADLQAVLSSLRGDDRGLATFVEPSGD